MLTEHDLYDLLTYLNAGTEPVTGDVDHHGRAFELFSGARGATTAEDLARGLAELGIDQDEGPEEAEAYLAELASDLTSGGAVLAVDGQGFRTVDVYTTAEELAEAWTDAEAYVAEREQEAEAELAREVQASVDADLPEAWTVEHVAWTMGPTWRVPCSSREEAEALLGDYLTSRAAEGFIVDGPVRCYGLRLTSSGLARELEAYLEDPSEAVMQSDVAGTVTVYWNGPAREAELERRLERARGY